MLTANPGSFAQDTCIHSRDRPITRHWYVWLRLYFTYGDESASNRRFPEDQEFSYPILFFIFEEVCLRASCCL